MIEIQGKFNTAKVFTDSIEPEAYTQILNHPIYNKINYWIKDISMPTPKAITITAQSIDDPESEVEIQLTQREHKAG